MSANVTRCVNVIWHVSKYHKTSATVTRCASNCPQTFQQVSPDVSTTVIRYVSKCHQTCQQLSNDISAIITKCQQLSPDVSVTVIRSTCECASVELTHQVPGVAGSSSLGSGVVWGGTRAGAGVGCPRTCPVGTPSGTCCLAGRNTQCRFIFMSFGKEHIMKRVLMTDTRKKKERFIYVDWILICWQTYVCCRMFSNTFLVLDTESLHIDT